MRRFFLAAAVALALVAPPAVRADALWDEYADFVKKVECLDPTPSGESYVALRSGEAAQLRFPVPKEKPVGYWINTGSIVALSGKGSSYRLVLHVDAADGPVAFEGPIIADGDNWNAANQTQVNLTEKLTDAHAKQGYVDVYAVATVEGDGWALYRHQKGRPILAYLAELTPEIGDAMRSAKAMRERGIAVIPAPQKITLGKGDFRLSAKTRILLAKSDAEDAFAAADLAEQLSEVVGAKIQVPPAGAKPGPGTIVLLRSRGKPESYRLRVTPEGIRAEGADAAGLFYAAQTIAQLASGRGSEARIPACEVEDYPAYPLRGLQYDIARGQTVNVPFVKRVIRELARCKLNAIMFYGEDDYRFVKYPFLGREGTFTPEKAKELSDYARRYHMQLIPQFESLGHAAAVLGHPEVKELQEAGSSWVFCTCNPKVWEFLDDCFAELAGQFPYSKYLHTGADEFEDGFGLCPQCKAKVAQVGLTGLYAEHMNRLNQLCKKHGRTMLFWPSHGASEPERSYLTLKSVKLLERDCIPTEWIYHGPAAYPELKQYLDAGFQDCWTSPAVVCYSVIWPDYETTFRGIRGMLRAGIDSGVKGTCTTTWEWMFGALFNNSWPGMMYVPECAWSLGRTTRDDYLRRFAARFYGIGAPDAADRIRDTLASPFPGKGEGARHRDSRMVRDLLWCGPLQVRSHFSQRIPGLRAAAPAMVAAADESLARAAALRKDAGRNADLLSSAELAFRLHRLAARKLVAFEDAAVRYGAAVKRAGDDAKAAAADVETAAGLLDALAAEYRGCADDLQVAVEKYGHWKGDREKSLEIAAALDKIVAGLREAAGKLAAGETRELPPGEQFGLASGICVKLGAWAPEQMSTEGAELRLDATGKIAKPGVLRVEWTYTTGAHGLVIERVALLCDDTEVAADEHRGWAGSGSNGNVYTLPLKELKPGAKLTLVAKVRSAGGTQSNGEVWLIVPDEE